MPCPRSIRYPALLALLTVATGVHAQSEDEDDPEIEEVVVTGTQIKGASIADALAVSVLEADDIDALGIDDGADLLEQLVEQGQNYFSEAENISGGVNSARGDIGAYNLRNLGTGNTLVLLNGRRLVNAASYQTEAVGGSFVPVNTVNSQSLPPTAISRVEVLRDGASAIYGADAVAGVVNYVLKRDFEGTRLRVKYADFENTPRNDLTLSVEWGRAFNAGRSNIGVYAKVYQRDRVNSQDDPRWADSDLRWRLDPDSPWAEGNTFRNNSANSSYRQYDLVASARSVGLRDVFTDSSGEFETYPAGDERCEYDIGYGTCGAIDGQGTYRYNLNENRDLVSELTRTNIYAYLDHAFDNGIESQTEFAAYLTATNTQRHPSQPFSTVKLQVGAANYYNPFGPCGSPNRLPEDVIPDVPCEGLDLTIDFGRFAEVPRIVDNDGATWRFLQAFTGTWEGWDWDTGVVWSRAEKEDVTRNRVSNTLMQQALEDPTPAAYNPFSGRANTNIERTLIDVRRDNYTELMLIDFKASSHEILSMPAGAVGFLAGIEFRRESFDDDRDPRLDGTIAFTDLDGDTFPFVSDVVNSSPTPDSRGGHNVFSAFTELAIPLHDTLDVQVALRFESFSDVGSTTVGRFAFGYRPLDMLLIRGSWSEAFRAPNLVTINEDIVARQNTRNDWTCFFADPNEDTLDCRYSLQRIAQGSQHLEPEGSDNLSFGLVLTPLAGLTITADVWSIEKQDSIGLFGEENHTLLDLVLRVDNGGSDCDSFVGNPAISRAAPNDDELTAYAAAGICPAGRIEAIDDRYANLDQRIIRGVDYAIYYDIETDLGEFRLSYQVAELRRLRQTAGGDAATLVAAQAAGDLPADFPVSGFADLIRRNGNPEEKSAVRLRWSRGPWTGAVSTLLLGDAVHFLSDGSEWLIPEMRTYNAYLDYTFKFADDRLSRVRVGSLNFTNERAPLADRYFGYFADMHQDLGARYYVELRLDL